MSKFSSKLLSFMLVLILSLSLVFPAHATKNLGVENSNGFYVISEEVPSEAIQHTQETIAGMIQDLYPLETIKIGTPFKLVGTDLYYFIIYSNENIVGLYRVFQTDSGYYSGIFGEYDVFLEALEEVRKLTTKDQPAEIVVGDYEDVYAIVNNEVYTLLKDPEGKLTGKSKVKEKKKEKKVGPAKKVKKEKVVDSSEGIDFEIPISAMSSATTYKFLQTGWAETQGSQSWCSAFVTASILRYRTGKSVSTISAKKIMEYTFPKVSSSELTKKALSFDNAIKYAKTHGISPIKSDSRLSYSSVKTEINNDRPVYMAADNVTTGVKVAHAFVLRGYNDNSGNSFYSVWNPWYEKYERVYTKDNSYYTNSGTQYRWSKTIYNWK